MAKRALGPATLALTAAVREHCDPAHPWLVGCSGGRDSLALAVVATQVAVSCDVECRALVVDHGLQDGSERVAAAVVAQLETRGVAVSSVRVTVQPEGGPEAGARRARYAALRAAAAGGEVLLGHTLDDQAETVLLGLARGSGTRSLAGMAVRTDDLVRPLLGLRRAVTAQACEELGLEWWDDPHNDSPAYARSRVRTTALPVLESALGPGVAEALARTARLSRDDADLLDRLAAEAVDPTATELDAVMLAGLAPALRRRGLLAWLRAQGAGDLQLVHLDAVDALVTRWHGQGPIDLPGGFRVTRSEGHLRASTD